MLSLLEKTKRLTAYIGTEPETLESVQAIIKEKKERFAALDEEHTQYREASIAWDNINNKKYEIRTAEQKLSELQQIIATNKQAINSIGIPTIEETNAKTTNARIFREKIGLKTEIETYETKETTLLNAQRPKGDLAQQLANVKEQMRQLEATEQAGGMGAQSENKRAFALLQEQRSALERLINSD